MSSLSLSLSLSLGRRLRAFSPRDSHKRLSWRRNRGKCWRKIRSAFVAQEERDKMELALAQKRAVRFLGKVTSLSAIVCTKVEQKDMKKVLFGFGSVFSRDLVGMALCVFTWATKQSKTKETQTKKRVSQVVVQKRQRLRERDRNRERPADLPGLPSLGRRRDAGSQTPAQHLRTTAENLNSYSLLRCRCWIVLNT